VPVPASQRGWRKSRAAPPAASGQDRRGRTSGAASNAPWEGNGNCYEHNRIKERRSVFFFYERQWKLGASGGHVFA